MSEKKENIIEEIEVVTTKKETVKVDKEKEALQAQVADLSSKLEMLMGQFAQIQIAKPVETETRQPASRYDDVVIVHLIENAPGLKTHIQLGDFTINMVSFGETRTLTVQQFESLVGQYRSWFDNGIIAVASESEYYAKRNGLKTFDDFPVQSDFVQYIANCSASQLEDLYEKLPMGQKDFIISLFKRMLLRKDNMASPFKDLKKLETLNRLSNYSLKMEIEELTAQNNR